MDDTRIFSFMRDWDPDTAIMVQARDLVTARLQEGYNLPDLFLAAMDGLGRLPMYAIAWLWYNALAITIQELMREPKAKI
ncbi:hypothetical protein F5Y05DRAFT_415553 [Hypoxylon sp. FL0543]|nr:hypothetical protein F5Y05DRAFT_415553 [Hypoxylon sp. FL0543]